MTDLYSTPRDRRPVPSLQVAASAGIAEAERTVVLALRLDAPGTVLDTALRMARFEKAALRVVVFSSDSPAGPLDNDPAQITELVEALSSAGVEFEVLRAEADVASQVIDLADEQSAELIVISTRRRSAVMKLLLGSSVQRVILEATCPVVVVK